MLLFLTQNQLPIEVINKFQKPPFFFLKMSSGDWQQVWDKESQEYYYWNTKTNITTWEKPNGFLKPLIAGEKNTEPKKLIPDGMDIESKEYYDWYMEQLAENAEKEATSSFAAFQKKDEFKDLNYLGSDSNIRPAKYTRAFNQMGMYFDVSQYGKQMADQKANSTSSKAKLSKKQIDKFKKKKLERQKKSLIYRLGPDE